MDGEFYKLPSHVRDAITHAKLHSKHSEFYYRLKDLNSKITKYKSIFYDRIPMY